MKKNLLNKLWLRVGMIVAIMTTALSGTALADNYSQTYDYSALKSLMPFNGSWADADTYLKVPQNDDDVVSFTIPIESDKQPTSDITLTFNIATFGNGTNPASTNTTITAVGTEVSSNWNGSGVSKYPSSKTYVDGVMTITKPDNPTTLAGLTITMGVNSGVKIFRLQSLKVDYTYGGGTPVTYTVIYDANGGSGTMTDSNSPYASGATVTVLDNDFTRDGYEFVKWNTAADGSGTDYDEGDTFAINANTTLYAQWEEQSGDAQWVLTSLADLTSSDVFVIVGNGYAMTNNNGTSSAPATSAVTITGSAITSTVAANIQWTVSGDATNGYTFYPNGSTTTWLYCNTTASSSSNNNMRVGTGDRKVFKLNSNNYLITSDTYTTRYLSIYNDADWRGYTSTSNGAVALSFYKKVTGGVIPPSITASTNEIAYNETSGSITYSVTNPVEGGVVTATSSENWLTVGTPSNGTIALTCAANSETTVRTTTVTLTYTYNTNETVTTTVTVTQAGAPESYTTIPALFEAATSTETSVYVTFGGWVVSGVSTNGKNVFVTDNNGNGFVIFDNNGGLNNDYTVGDILSGTAVSCNLKKYNGFAELLNVNVTDLTITAGGTVSVANVAMANLAGVNTGAVVSYENLTCSVDNNKYYLSDGTTTLQVYNSLFAFDALVAGKTYNITGVYQQFNNTKEILPRSADDIVEVDAPVQTTITAGALNHVTISRLWDGDMEDITLGDNVEVGTLVYFSLNVEAGYTLESVSVSDASNNEMTLEENQGSWSFTMPNSSVIINATAVPSDGDSYALYTGALVEGDYIIYYDGRAMNTTVSNDRLQYEEVTPASNDVITISATDNAIVWHIAPSGDYWTIYNAAADAYAASTGVKNKAQMLADGTDDMALWTVSGTETYEFVNKKNTANEVNANLRNNGTYGFACYATGTGGALSLYKKVYAPETITLNTSGYATFASTSAVDFTEAETNGYSAWAVTGVNGTEISFQQITGAVEAGTGVLLKGEPSATISPVYVESGDAVTGNKLVGITSATAIEANQYYGLSGSQFKKVKAGTVNAGKALLPASVVNGTEVKTLSFVFEEDATGISNLNANFNANEGAIYNLSGQMVNGKLPKGIYIVNGKKILK